MQKNQYPKGWNEKRIQRVLAHYESQTDEQAVEEDERAFEEEKAVLQVPIELVPLIREIIAQYKPT